VFIVSDKQGSGKTFITAGIAATMQSLGYTVGYYKPVQTGAVKQDCFLFSQDIAFIKKIDSNLNTSVSYVLGTDAIPMLAAKNENVVIQSQTILKDFYMLKNSSDFVLIEGYNGIMTPLADNIEIVDLITVMQANLLIVAEPSKDVLEKILLTVSYAKHANIRVCGVILNKFLHLPDINTKNLVYLIEKYAEVPVVGVVSYLSDITPFGLIDTTLQTIDLETVFGMKIPKLNNNME
nr:dethiobiotin synthase [Candidatus Gastranaerophilales bacterium]